MAPARGPRTERPGRRIINGMLTRLLAVLCVFVLISCAQKPAKKSHVLTGTVEAVDTKEKTMTVNHQKVEGWMDAMTMAYPVHGDITAKPGDQIQAKVYDDDYSLYEVQVTGKPK